MSVEINGQNLNKFQAEPPVLSIYTDYREFLKDFYSFKQLESKDSVRPYSYATFSAGANIRSPNYLKLIIEGQRNLSPDMIKKFSKSIGFQKEESDEFEVLVLYNQAKDPLERNRYLKKLSEIRVRRQIKNGEINTQAWDKVPNWISWVLFSLTDQKDVNFDPANLRKIIRERASTDEIRKALELLLASGDLVQKENGQIEKGREIIQGYEDIPVALVRKIQAELIYLGLESLFQDDSTEREFGALTMALTEGEFEQLKFELRQLRKRFFKDISVNRKSTKGDRVYQLNIQLFPVTQSQS